MHQLFGFFGEYYYLIIILQAICVFHCVRKGNQQNWIWLIVFLPAIGCLIYFFSEIVTRREVDVVQSNLTTIINPSGRIRDLERKVEFTPTFENKSALADAYLEAGMIQQAIELYESCLTGIFSDTPSVIVQLIRAYYQQERYDDVIRIAQKVLKSAEFIKTHSHVLYALALEQTGRPEDAEQEFSSMKGRYSNYEARYNYGLFLTRAGRSEEARSLYLDIMNESAQMTSGEARHGKEWFRKTREELAKLRN